MELPMSIRALGADEMRDLGVTNVQDISEFVPNVSLSETQRKNDPLMFIRGIGGGFRNPNRVFGTAMYVDGHLVSGNLGSFLSVADIERVEVFRGPQGTLWGKNVTGGAVNLVTSKPGPEFDSSFILRAGEFGEEGVLGMVNVPITDNVAMRVNLSSEKTEGVYYNELLDEYIDSTEEQGIAFALRLTPGQWTIDTRLATSEDRDGNRGGQCREYPNEEFIRALNNDPLGTPANLAYRGPGPGPLGSYPGGVGAWGTFQSGIGNLERFGRGATVDYINTCATMHEMGDFVNFSNTRARSLVDNDMVSVDTTWNSDGDMGPFSAASFQIRTASRETRYRYQQENDYTPLSLVTLGTVPSLDGDGTTRNTDEFELIFNATLNDRFDFTAGLYWLDDEALSGARDCIDDWRAAYDPNGVNGNPGPDGIPGTPDDPAGTINGRLDDSIPCEPNGGHVVWLGRPGAGADIPGYQSGITSGTSRAIFGQFNYSFSEAWSLSFGLRAMEDDRSQISFEFDAVPDACNTLVVGEVLGDPELCTPTLIMNRASILQNGVYVEAADTYSDVTPMVSLTRTLRPGGSLDSGMVYFLISEGFLTGAFNDELGGTNLIEPYRSALATLIPYGPEHVTNYEVGFKGVFSERLSIVADIFFMDYTEKQENIEIDNSDGRFGSAERIDYTTNAAAVEVSGVELELRAIPWENGGISLDVGWLNNEYSEYMVYDLDLDRFVDLSNTRIQARTPDWTVTASIEHAFTLGNGARLIPQLGLYSQADYEWLQSYGIGLPSLTLDQESAYCHQDGYSKWRTRLSYESAQGNWRASLYGDNVTDERILEDCEVSRSGTYRFGYGPPEWWGVEFSMEFGARSRR
jgi:outer membrane receptor protein involved in Fe transport